MAEFIPPPSKNRASDKFFPRDLMPSGKVGGFIHKDLAAGRWFQMSLAEQLGNVGSEVGRAANWLAKNDLEQSRRALERAFDLLDLTINDKRWIGSKLKELCRVREVLADTFYGDRAYGATPQSMEKYFYHYAVEARNAM